MDASDPFPFLWDGKGMARGDRLKGFPVSDLVVGSTLAVKTHISSYAIASSTPPRTGYTMSLRAAFVLEDPDPARTSIWMDGASVPRRRFGISSSSRCTRSSRQSTACR
jgi:hypothetical protein